jgi:hypothetical protein
MMKLDSKIELCEKESQAISVFGRDKIFEIYNSLRQESNQCACCGYKPNALQRLKLHFIDINPENEIQYKAVLLCDACFLIKHFNKAVEENCVALANSEFSQIDLLKIQRMSNTTTNKEILKKTIVILKLSPKDYLEQIKEDKHMFSPYIKVLFNNNFKWDNCK